MPDRRDHRSRLLAQNDVLGRFLNQPTLRVTPRQVARLCHLRLDACQRILNDLAATNTVGLDAGGRYYLLEASRQSLREGSQGYLRESGG